MSTTTPSFFGYPFAQLTSTKAKIGHMDASERFFRNFSILPAHEKKGKKGL
jgi:hypothetical protein